MTELAAPRRTLAEKLVPQVSALLIVDMVNDFVDPQGKAAVRSGRPLDHIRRIIPRIQELAAAARTAKVLVVHVQHTTLKGNLSNSGPWLDARLNAPYSAVDVCMEGTWGHAIIEELEPQFGDPIVQKYRYGAFVGTNCNLILRSRGIETVVCCGASTNVCVEATAREAFSHEYYVVLPSDACGSWDTRLHEASLRTAGSRYAAICTSKDILQVWNSAIPLGEDDR